VSFRPKPLGARAAIIAPAGATAADDLKGALIYRPTCPLQAYAKNRPKPVFNRCEDATKGTREVDGRKIVIIAKDDPG
jgi:branched-chain amino acid transport system substrate-binding protein